MATMAISSSLIVLGSILGICGIKKGNAFMICVFQIFVIIFLIVFFSLGIAAEVMPGKFFDGNCSSSTNSAIVAASKSFNISKSLCLTAGGCPCNMSPNALSKYDTDDRAILNSPVYRINDPQGYSQIQQCTVANISGLDFTLAAALS